MLAASGNDQNAVFAGYYVKGMTGYRISKLIRTLNYNVIKYGVANKFQAV